MLHHSYTMTMVLYNQREGHDDDENGGQKSVAHLKKDDSQMRTARQPVERKPKDTSKAKPQIADDLGMTLALLESMTICWVPVPLNDEDKRMLNSVCEFRSTDDKKVKLHSLLSKMVTDYIEVERENLEEEAGRVAEKISSELTEEEIEKQTKSLERKLELLKLAMSKKSK